MTRKRKRRVRGELFKLQNKIWILCKNIIRSRYEHTCYTCGAKNLKGVNLQTGHMIPKSACKAQMKYDLRNLRLCCQKCNLRQEGMGAMFYRNMLSIEGIEYMDSIFNDYKNQKKLKSKEILEYYKNILEEYKEIKKSYDK